jgi:SPP1 gp7 family putative phage head morphogenesis protein
LNGLDYTDEEIEKIINDLYGGSISREVLPVGLYNDIKARLNKAVFDGFGGTYSDFDTSTEAGLIMAGFEKNIAVFSGAKTFQQVNDMSNFLFAGKDKIPFSEFKKYASEIFETYNKNWLNTEYNTALSQASSARQWNDIQENKEIFPLLKYITIGDQRVREQHKDLDEVVFAVGDKFWNDYFPPNDWNCRCTTEQLEENEEQETDPKRTFDPIPELFKMNSGKDKIIFREDIHPYLKVDQRYKVALGKNFDLPFVPEVKIVKPRKPRAPKVPVPEVPEALPITQQSAEMAGEKIKNITFIKEAKEVEIQLQKIIAEQKIEIAEINKIDFRKNREEYSARVLKFNDQVKLRNRLVTKKESLLRKAEAEIINILKVDNPIEPLSFVSLNGEFDASYLKMKPKLEKFSGFISNKWQPLKKSVNVYIKKKVRASYASGVYNRVTLSPSDGTETVLHELGHFLEHDRPELHARIMEFYNRRTANDTVEALRNVTGNKAYGWSEVTKKDNFIEPYIGKYYNREGSSEILTMWFTEVFKNPTRLIEKDFDYFETIYNLIRESK